MSDPGHLNDSRLDEQRMKAVLLAAAALAFAATPFVTRFNGFDPNLFPVPQDDPPIQPAGYAFAIWAPIYLWLLVSAGFGLIMRAGSSDWDVTRWPLIGSLAVGAAWLPVAQASAIWATILIWVMLSLVLLALFRTPRSDYWFLHAPVALYTGWLTAASWVAVGLVGAGYDIGFGSYGWAILSLAGALAMAALVQLALPNSSVYTAAVIWALVGVAVSNYGEIWSLVVLPLAGAIALVAFAFRSAQL